MALPAQEAAACRTIAARGVLLVSTAHGSSLGDLLRNPDLQGLVGGVKAVTLGDRLAQHDNRGQKVCGRLLPGNLFRSTCGIRGSWLHVSECRSMQRRRDVCPLLRLCACVRVRLVAGRLLLQTRLERGGAVTFGSLVEILDTNK